MAGAALFPRVGQQVFTAAGANSPEPASPEDPTIAINSYTTSVAVNAGVQSIISVIYATTSTTEPTVQLALDPTFVDYTVLDTIPASATGLSQLIVTVPVQGLLRVQNSSDAVLDEVYIQSMVNTW